MECKRKGLADRCKHIKVQGKYNNFIKLYLIL